MPKCSQKWSPDACHSKKNNKEAKLIERKVCFILDAGPKANSYPDDQRMRLREEAASRNSSQLLTVDLRLVIGGLTRIILIILGTVNLQFCVWFLPIEANSWNCGSLCHG